MKWKPPPLVALLLALVAAAGITGLTISLVDSDQDGKPDTITVHVDGADPDRKADESVTVPEVVVDRAETVLERDLRVPGPETPPVQLREADDAADRNRANLDPLPVAGASQDFPGCVTRFVANQSSRNGVRPIWQVLHYTVSGNRPGWSDVNAIVALFDRPSFGASSHFVIDAEGNCAYIVPIEAKSWTEAAANPFGISYEVIAVGSERAYLETAGYRKLASVMREVQRRTGIGLVRASTNGCSPGTRGVVQHKDFGICGGGHVDITPFSVDQVVRIVRRLTRPSPLTLREKHWVAGRACGRLRSRKQLLDARHRRGRPWRKARSGARRREIARTISKRC